MNTATKFAVLTLVMFAITIYGVSQGVPAVVKPLNLERGVIGPVSTSPNWSGYSALNAIPGAGLLPTVTKATALYLGFTGGTTADISNMVLYTTARASTKITAVTPVTFGGVSNPSLHLSTVAVCPSQPLSAGNPCIVRLDPLTLVPSALSDYYLVVFFTAADSNNQAIVGTVGANRLSSLTGWFIQSDQTHLTVGQSIPAGNNGNPPYFLMYVMTN